MTSPDGVHGAVLGTDPGFGNASNATSSTCETPSAAHTHDRFATQPARPGEFITSNKRRMGRSPLPDLDITIPFHPKSIHHVRIS